MKREMIGPVIRSELSRGFECLWEKLATALDDIVSHRIVAIKVATIEMPSIMFIITIVNIVKISLTSSLKVSH